MNHKELVFALALRLGVTQASVNAVLTEAVSQVHSVLDMGGSVSVSGLGDFAPKRQAARIGRNPRTGAVIRIKAKKVPGFRPAAALKRAVL